MLSNVKHGQNNDYLTPSPPNLEHVSYFLALTDPIGKHDTLLCFLGLLAYLIGGKLKLTLKKCSLYKPKCIRSSFN